jgi:hypothetical protein
MSEQSMIADPDGEGRQQVENQKKGQVNRARPEPQAEETAGM